MVRRVRVWREGRCENFLCPCAPREGRRRAIITSGARREGREYIFILLKVCHYPKATRRDAPLTFRDMKRGPHTFIREIGKRN